MSFPRMGRQQSVKDVHKLVTRRFGYVVCYWIDEVASEIVVLTIHHPARSSTA